MLSGLGDAPAFAVLFAAGLATLGSSSLAVVMLVMSFIMLLAINGLQAWTRKRQGK